MQWLLAMCTIYSSSTLPASKLAMKTLVLMSHVVNITHFLFSSLTVALHPVARC
jgi:hypothetical protein